ncbi:MAG: hypothetical protein ACXAEU_00180 [Candidatus Hodarchaeales archaeon]|jgi:hypothetical protein
MVKTTSNGPKIKIAKEIVYYALHNCIACVYLFPVISYARSNMLVENVDISMSRNKEEYKTVAKPVIDRYFPNYPVFSPLIIMKNPGFGVSGMVRPEIVQECADLIIQHLNVLGDDAVIDFMDGDLELKVFFQSLLLKMVSNIEEEIEEGVTN